MPEFWNVRKARKEYNCAQQGCIIHPGDEYIDSVLPPWTLIQDDPDYPAWKQGTWEHTRAHRFDQHNDDGMIVLFHRTTFAAKVEIVGTRQFISKEKHRVYFSNRRDGQAEGYGDEVVTIRIPRQWANPDDEFPNGEMHFWVDRVRASSHIVDDWD